MKKAHQWLKMATRYNQETDCGRQTITRIALAQNFNLSNHKPIVD